MKTEKMKFKFQLTDEEKLAKTDILKEAKDAYDAAVDTFSKTKAALANTMRAAEAYLTQVRTALEEGEEEREVDVEVIETETERTWKRTDNGEIVKTESI